MQSLSPYKPARELGIEPWEHEELTALVGPLARGELRFDMRTAMSEVASREVVSRKVQMCGTVACIGGHIALRHGMSTLSTTKYVNGFKPLPGRAQHPLTPLFYPALANAWACTAEQAGAAIVNFLTLGEPRWDDVMRGRRRSVGAAAPRTS